MEFFEWWSIFFLFINLYIIIVLLFLILDNRDSSSTIAWVLVLILLPLVGLAFYLLFGKNWRRISRKKLRDRRYVDEKLATILDPLVEKSNMEINKSIDSRDDKDKKDIMNLIYKNSYSPVTNNNEVEVINSGKEKFARLMKDIEDAKRHIHLEYFIWRSDKLTKKIHKMIIKKAKEGVEVRIVYDTMGGLFFKRRDRRELKKAGIKLHSFSNRFHTLNYRNHRKIAIIDGKVGYIGGMNMGQEYIDGGKKFKSWRDTHLRIKGDSVKILQSIFVSGWHIATKEELFRKEYFPNSRGLKEKTSVQIVTSGPDTEWESVKQLYFTLINSSKNYVYIQSPYFIIDPSMQMALKTAALRGVDVRIMVAGIPDKRVPYWSAFTFFEPLLRSGVKIYHYNSGFLHCKTIVADDKICSVGSANMDIRSFNLSYESNAAIYDKKTSEKIKKRFFEDLKNCREFSLDNYKSLSLSKKLRNSIARLFAPLL